MGRHFEVDDVIGKSRHGAASDWQVWRQSPEQGAGARYRHELIDGRINGVQKLDTEVNATSFIPSSRSAVFSVRLVVKANAGIRCRSSASARRRTSSQGTPPDSSASARRARRSISVAQAASTSPGCSTAASSRLARSSAATSARSSRGNASASRSTSCARDGIRPFYGSPPPIAPDWRKQLAERTLAERVVTTTRAPSVS
jgi:hypothetical protein